MPPQRSPVPKRAVLAGSGVSAASWSTKFINSLMDDGKKTMAERIFYGALD